jgi:hypothetical protein
LAILCRQRCRLTPLVNEILIIPLAHPRLFLPLRNGFLTRLALIRQLHALKVRLPDVFES